MAFPACKLLEKWYNKCVVAIALYLIPLMNPDIQKAFHEAVSNNDVETARRMITAGADVNAPYDEYENRSFLDACYKGNLDLVKMLVEAGANVDLPDACGTVPLVRAIVSIHDTNEVVKYLIDCGADVNACLGESGTPLEAAVQEHAADIVKVLLDAGAAPRVSSEKREASLLTASDWGDVDIVEMLLEAGADPNSHDEDNYTPLAAACRWGHAEAAELLLKAGANPHATDSCYNDSILMDAAEGNNPKCIKMLLERNVDVNHVNYDDETALLYAVLHPNNEKIVSMLLEAGANPNITGGELGSPLSIVMHDKEYRSAEILIKFGAKFSNNDDYYTDEVLENIDDHTLFYNLKDNGIVLRTDDEAVILYAKHACSYLLRKAIEAGANPNAADAAGKSALAWALEHPRHPQGCAARLIQHGATFAPELLIYAIRNRMRELVAALLKAGADANVQDERGNTALHYATRKNAAFLVRDLIAAGADIEVRNNANLTPLLVAVQSRSLESGSILLDAGANPYTKGGKHNMNAHALGERHQCRLRDKKLLKLPWDQTAQKNLVPYRFFCAALAGNSEKVRKLVDEGYDINAYDSEGYTALHMCVEYEDSITPLISNGANMYAETKDSTADSPAPAPAIAASFSLRENFVKFLDYGYDVNHIDSEGLTLLMHCARWDWEWGVRTLLERGADPSIRDKDGETALFYVCGLPNVCYDEIIDALLEYGADINATDNDGNTALLRIAHEEIEGDGTHLVLIWRGIDVNHRNNAGETALSIARRHGHKWLIRELLEAGAIED